VTAFPGPHRAECHLAKLAQAVNKLQSSGV